MAWVAFLSGALVELLFFGLIFYSSIVGWDRSVEAELARSPDAQICGNPGMVFLFLGLVGGAVGGTIMGVLVAKSVDWCLRGRSRTDSVPSLEWEEDVPSAKDIANEAKRASLRAEIIRVDGMIVEAKRHGDEIVAEKLARYRANLSEKLRLKS